MNSTHYFFFFKNINTTLLLSFLLHLSSYVRMNSRPFFLVFFFGFLSYTSGLTPQARLTHIQSWIRCLSYRRLISPSSNHFFRHFSLFAGGKNGTCAIDIFAVTKSHLNVSIPRIRFRTTSSMRSSFIPRAFLNAEMLSFLTRWKRGLCPCWWTWPNCPAWPALRKKGRDLLIATQNSRHLMLALILPRCYLIRTFFFPTTWMWACPSLFFILW